MKFSRIIISAMLALVAAAPLAAVDTAFWQLGTFDELLQGTLQGVSLTKEGELRLAPDARAVFNPDETMALSVAADGNHNLYIGTGQQGKVFRVDRTLKGSLFFTAPESQIFALASGPDGALYVGSSPEGKVYRVTSDGKSSVFFNPKSKYIWALAFDKQGRLYAATGDRGQIYRIEPSGKGEVFFDSKQTHIMCLALDPEDDLIAGSVPNGLLYRITPQGKAFVIYQAGYPEIHDVAIDAQGRIFAAAMGSPTTGLAPGVWGPLNPAVPTTTVTTVTVQASTGTRQVGGEPTQSPTPTTPAFNHPVITPQTYPPLGTGQGRGSLIEIHPDSSAETLWTSNNESIFGLAVLGKRVMFSTDSNGRIFELSPSADGDELTLLTETHEALATRLIVQQNDLYATTSNLAELVRVRDTPGHDGAFISPVKDTKFVSHWGVLAWRGEAPAGSSIEFYSRSGNSDRPDQTWSDWAGPYKNSAGSPIQSPPARYIQWKAVFHAKEGAGPALDDVTVAYLNQNLPPQIHSLTVSTSGERTGPGGTSAFPASAVNVVAIPPSPSPSPSGVSTPKPVTTISWQADDPNGDPLVYSLYVKAQDEHEWHLVKDKLQQSSYSVEPDSLADGQYVARLVASDEESNPSATARKAELLSAPFWIDNTPPEIHVLKQSVQGNAAEVRFRAEDAISPLRAAQAATDDKDWNSLLSDDGVVDSRSETFTVRAHNLGPGEHVIALRVADTAGNVGVGKAVVRIH